MQNYLSSRVILFVLSFDTVIVFPQIRIFFLFNTKKRTVGDGLQDDSIVSLKHVAARDFAQIMFRGNASNVDEGAIRSNPWSLKYCFLSF